MYNPRRTLKIAAPNAFGFRPPFFIAPNNSCFLYLATLFLAARALPAKPCHENKFAFCHQAPASKDSLISLLRSRLESRAQQKSNSSLNSLFNESNSKRIEVLSSCTTLPLGIHVRKRSCRELSSELIHNALTLPNKLCLVLSLCSSVSDGPVLFSPLFSQKCLSMSSESFWSDLSHLLDYKISLWEKSSIKKLKKLNF